MAKSSNPKRKKAPKTVLKLPDLEQSKSAVLNILVFSSSQRSYGHAIREFIEWYCSEPRTGVQQNGRHSLSHCSRAEALRPFHHQSEIGRGPATGLRSVR